MPTLSRSLILLLAVTACSGQHPPPDGSGGGSGGAGGGSTDAPPYAFPGAVPQLFGYDLVDAYPGAPIFSVMVLQWIPGSDQPFALTRDGYILRMLGGDKRDILLDFNSEVCACDEGGALGMALHPKFNDAADPKPYAYVWYNHVPYAMGETTHQRLSRFTYDPITNRFDAATELVLVDQHEAAPVHNGARVHFGSDGFLYFGNGDDQRANETAQRLDYGLFSGIFRIDVDMQGGTVSHPPPRMPTDAVTTGYFIPNDNPFVGMPNVNEEYFALGFRNPYAFTFDRANGDMWIGDVGDNWREEIDRGVKGGNYGWPLFEGDKPRTEYTLPLAAGTLQTPVYTYPHHEMGDLSATMMGEVYHGTALPELAGKIVYSDWPTGRVWAFDPVAKKRTTLYEAYTWFTKPVGFAQDPSGEVLIIAWTKIWKLVRAGPTHVPTKLSETGVFKDLATLTPSGWFRPYTIRSPLWSDGAAKRRWVYVPGGQTASLSMNVDAGSVDMKLPPGSMVVKQFDLPAQAQPTNGRTKRLETRFMIVGAEDVYGLSYQWKADGSDAELVTEGHDEEIGDVNPQEARTWHYPSFGECWACHRAENRIIGFRDWQLNFAMPDGNSQLQSLVNAGMLDGKTMALARPAIADPADTTATPSARAAAYLAANCSHCHHPGSEFLGGGSWNALPFVADKDRGLINQPHNNMPMANAFGLWDAPLVKPGDPMHSILRARINSTDADLMMPLVGRHRVDPLGSAIIDAWISSLPP